MVFMNHEAPTNLNIQKHKRHPISDPLKKLGAEKLQPPIPSVVLLMEEILHHLGRVNTLTVEQDR